MPTLNFFTFDPFAVAFQESLARGAKSPCHSGCGGIEVHFSAIRLRGFLIFTVAVRTGNCDHGTHLRETGPRRRTESRDHTLPHWPQFDENAIRAVEDVLRSGKVNYWTGPHGMEFEKQFAAWQGSKYAVSVATGTAALHVCLAALGIGPGDEVIVPSYTFIATSFSVVQAGAIPRFADVNLEDHCISVESAEKLVTQRTKAIMPVHLYGNVCDMDKIKAFAKKHNLFVIEDNAEAFGGAYKGKKTGTLGHMAGVQLLPEQDLHHRRRRRHGHHRRRGARLGGAQLPRPRLRREGAAEPAGAGAEAALHPQPRGLELPHDRDAVGHRPGGAGADGHVEHAAAAAQRPDPAGRARPACRRSSTCRSTRPSGRTAGTSAPSRWTSRR